MDPIKTPVKIAVILLLPLLPATGILLSIAAQGDPILTWVTGIVLLAVMFSCYWFYLRRFILQPLFDLNITLNRIMQSADITVRADNRTNHLGCTSPGDFNRLMDRVIQMINGSQVSIGRVFDVAVQFTTDAGLMENASRTQTEAASSIRKEVEALYLHISSVAEHARETEKQSTGTRDQSTDGARVVENATNTMNEIVNAFQTSTGMLDLLKGNTEDISGFASEITNISEQTNLLALNAAIEAARAGEQGRGFAVVADEVRNLAVRTNDATTHISKLINTIQQQTDSVISSMQTTSQAVTDGANILKTASESLTQINSSMGRMLDMTAEISAAGHYQKSSSQKISEQIEAIVDSAQLNNVVIYQTASSARKLLHLAQDVKLASSEFVLQKDELDTLLQTINEIRANAILAANAKTDEMVKGHVETIRQLDTHFEDVWKRFDKRPLSDSQKQRAKTFSDNWQTLIQARNITLQHASNEEFELAKENVVQNAAPKYKVAREALLALQKSMNTTTPNTDAMTRM